MRADSGPGVFHAVGDTVARATDLIQIEFRLFKAELAEKTVRIRAGLALILAGAVLLTAALFLLLQAVVLALVAAGLSAVAATLLVAAATVAIGLALVMSGRKQLDADQLVPDRTLTDIERDTILVKEKLS
jgi:putative superfamily III holin-X